MWLLFQLLTLIHAIRTLSDCRNSLCSWIDHIVSACPERTSTGRGLYRYGTRATLTAVLGLAQCDNKGLRFLDSASLPESSAKLLEQS